MSDRRRDRERTLRAAGTCVTCGREPIALRRSDWRCDTCLDRQAKRYLDRYDSDFFFRAGEGLRKRRQKALCRRDERAARFEAEFGARSEPLERYVSDGLEQELSGFPYSVPSLAGIVGSQAVSTADTGSQEARA